MRVSSFLFGVFATTALSFPVDPVEPDTPAGLNSTLAARAGGKSLLHLTTYAGDNCAHSAKPLPNVEYDYNYETEIKSYKLSRPLQSNEQLDFSQFDTAFGVKNPACGVFLASAAQNTPEDVAILHEIITTAQNSANVDRLPFRAIFAAYDQILAQHGLDPNHDQVLLRFLFRLGQQRGPEQSLYEAFEALLSELGIQILFGSEEDVSQEGGTENEVNRPTVVAQEPGSVPRRSRRASFSSFYDAGDETTRAIQHRLGSEESHLRGQKDRPATRATTRPTENVSARKARPKPTQVLPAPDRLTSKEFADNLVHYKRRRVSTSSYRSQSGYRNRSSKPLLRQSVPDEAISVSRPEYNSSLTDDGGLDDTVSSSTSRIKEQLHLARPNEHIDQFSETQILREVETFQQYRTHSVAKDAIRRWHVLAVDRIHQHREMKERAETHDARILVRQAFDQWHILFLARRQITETERFFSHLERRASKARDLYLLTKAFTHWAQCASEEVERTSVACRHILRTRYFNAWLEITAVNKFKVRHQAIRKFFWIWRSSLKKQLANDSKAVTIYYHNLAQIIYWRWFWNFCERRVPERRNARLKKRYFTCLLLAHDTNVDKDVRSAESRDVNLKRRYLTLWIERVRKIKVDRQQAEMIYQQSLTKRCIKEWHLQLTYLPLARHVAGMVNWRIVSSSLSSLVHRLNLEQQASQLNKRRIIRNIWTHWNDCLRWRTLSHQVDDRVTIEALYRWVLAERFVLLQRLNEERLKKRILETITNRWHDRTSRYERLRIDLAHRRNQALLSSVTRKWHKELLVQNQQNHIAFQFHAPRVAQETLQLWNVNYKRCRQLHTEATDAIFYFRASKSIKLWQKAVVESQKAKRRDAYISVRRRIKMDLARRLVAQWREKALHVSSLQQRARETDQKRNLHFATAMFDRWKDSLGFAISEGIEAGQNFNADLAYQQLQIWIERLRAQQQAEAKALDFVMSHVQKIAYEGLRAFQLKVLEYRSHEQIAGDLRASNERRHHRSFLRIWREQTNRKRGISSTEFSQSYRLRKPGTKIVANVVEPIGRAEEWRALDDEFEPGDWLLSQSQSSTTLLPGYLSTPSKRAARARALVRGSSAAPATPMNTTTPLMMRTPLTRRLHAPTSTISRLGRSTGGLRLAGFEDISEERSRTPGS
ncbi:hypothetical protein MMC13_006087 [Lambiella insularis]|nr:hypothetical protein [Lambiella insularis]